MARALSIHGAQRKAFCSLLGLSCHGGIAYISELLNIDPKAVSKGLEEIKKSLGYGLYQAARSWSLVYRRYYPNSHEIFLDIVSKHTAGWPMKVYLTGKKATNSFLENMPILFDTFLPKWNYKAVPEY